MFFLSVKHFGAWGFCITHILFRTLLTVWLPFQIHMLVPSKENRILSGDYQRRWTMENEIFSHPLSKTNVASPNSPPSTISVIANFKSPVKSTEIGRDFGTEFASMYRSIFRQKSPIHSLRSVTPSTRSTSAEGEDTNATEHRLQHARLILEHQELTDLCKIYRSRILELNEELEVICRENTELRLANTELVKLLSSQAALQSFLLSSSGSSPSRPLVDDFRRLSIGGVSPPDVHGPEEVLDISPTSVIENNRFERPNPERVTLPKSISVRSTIYQKTNPLVASHDGPSRVLPRSRTPSQLAPGTKKVYVRMPGVVSAEKTEEEAALELEVYNQGMTKTELCNKWQETGTCPYGDHCQFAHGITELRPVIRHPRYKTEVCRMILTGDRCPYGHRCHFRHSLTEEERSQLRNSVD